MTKVSFNISHPATSIRDAASMHQYIYLTGNQSVQDRARELLRAWIRAYRVDPADVTIKLNNRVAIIDLENENA